MKTIRAVIIIILVLAIITPATGQKNECVVRKSFAAQPGIKLSVTGKYGDINIVTTNQDSVVICATITLNHEDAGIAAKSFNLIKAEVAGTKDSITCTTEFDRRFFTSYTKGRKNFSVDYLIKVPSYSDLILSNEFGNIYLDEHSGYINVRLLHGSLSAKNLTRDNIKPVNYIYAFQGKIELNRINWLTATFSHCQQVTINNAGAVSISSEFSGIDAGSIRSLVIDSKSDRYNINSVENMVSKSAFSTIELNRLLMQLKSELVTGSVIIGDIDNNFSSIDLKSSMASVNIITKPKLAFHADITTIGTMTDINTTDFEGLSKTLNGNIIRITGSTGKESDTTPLIKIKATGGKLIMEN